MEGDPEHGHGPAPSKPGSDGVPTLMQHHAEHAYHKPQTCAHHEARPEQRQRKRERPVDQLPPGIFVLGGLDGRGGFQGRARPDRPDGARRFRDRLLRRSISGEDDSALQALRGL